MARKPMASCNPFCPRCDSQMRISVTSIDGFKTFLCAECGYEMASGRQQSPSPVTSTSQRVEQRQVSE